jgi:hypothetical protein
MKSFIKQNRSNLTIATIIALVVIASGAIWLTVRAAGFFASVEPDNASLTSNVKVITDTTASGGKAIQFGSGSGGGVPVAANFPTLESVGPATTPTQTFNDCYFDASQSGQVIDGKVLNCDSAGGVRFTADAANIVFRNSIIKGQMFTIGNTPGDASADQTGRAPIFTVEDSKIQQLTTIDYQDRAACCSHYTIKRSLIEGTHSGIGAHNNVVLEGNFITTNGTDSHSSGVRILKNTVLRGNTIICKPVTPGSDGGCSASGVFYSEALSGESAAAYNLTIENNYFKRGVTLSGASGGPWNATRFINCKNRTDCVNIKFTGNLFDLGWGSDAGEFPLAYGGNLWSGNYWTDGASAVSGQNR